MSKFIDRLGKVGMHPPTPMGFSTASRRDESVPQMMLIGSLEPDGLARDPDLPSASVDAVVVRLSSLDQESLGGILEPLKDHLWGVYLPAFDDADIERLKEHGCDFIVFQAENAAASVLNDEELGKVIDIGPGLDEDTARAIQDLPIDAVLYSPAEDLLPLTVGKLFQVEGVRGLVDKPFLMATPSNMGPAELEVLRNAGVTGLVMELSSVESVAEAKEAIANLPRRKARAASRDAMAPQSAVDFEPHIHGGDEGDVEGDDI